MDPLPADLPGRLRAICLALPGVTERPSHGAIFRPPYVGGRGWIGVRLDRDIDWTEIAEIAEICRDAYRVVAPARLVAELDRRQASSPLPGS